MLNKMLSRNTIKALTHLAFHPLNLEDPEVQGTAEREARVLGSRARM